MKIPVLHLEEGVHHFEKQIKADQVQFGKIDNYTSDINLSVTLNKFEKNIICDVVLQTKAKYTCDRCLLKFFEKLSEKFEILFHVGADEFLTEEEDVVIIPPETVELDLVPYVREYLILGMPMKHICKEECRGLCPNCGANLNEGSCNCETTTIDPRWEKLKELKSEN